MNEQEKKAWEERVKDTRRCYSNYDCTYYCKEHVEEKLFDDAILAADAELTLLRAIAARAEDVERMAKELYKINPEYKWNGSVVMSWDEISQWSRNGLIEDARALSAWLTE